jgi:hypothetical protein
LLGVVAGVVAGVETGFSLPWGMGESGVVASEEPYEGQLAPVTVEDDDMKRRRMRHCTLSTAS